MMLRMTFILWLGIWGILFICSIDAGWYKFPEVCLGFVVTLVYWLLFKKRPKNPN
jgi:hypothetical protein